MKKAWAAGIIAVVLAVGSGAFGQDTAAAEAAAGAGEAAAGGGEAAAAGGEGAGSSDYDMVQVEAGLGLGSLDGTLDKLTDGARIVLYSSKDPNKRLPISANEMLFSWEAGECVNVQLIGRVVVDHPEAHVRSEKADWNRSEGVLTFTGDPIIRNAEGQELRGQRVVVNMVDETYQVQSPVIPNLSLGGKGLGGGAAADPSLLTEKDVLDWPGLLSQVKTEAATPPSVGKQVVAQLDASAQKMITSVPVETLVENKGALVKQMNKVLASPAFYSADAWNGKLIDPQTRDLLTKKDLAGPDLTRANRALLETAYPGKIAPRRTSAQ